MFSIIIPCLNEHLTSLYNIICSFIAQDNNLINEILVIVNNYKKNDIEIIDRQKSFLPDYVKYILIEDKTPPGICRNIGVHLSKSDYLIFHDADDIPHPQKLDILKYTFDNTNCHHILHLIQPLGFFYKKYDITKIENITNPKIIRYLRRKQEKDIDIGNIIKARVSHGLSAVKKDRINSIPWSNKLSGEDKQFNLDSIKKGNEMIMLNAFLSEYDRYSVKAMKKHHRKHYDVFIEEKQKKILFLYNKKTMTKSDNIRIKKRLKSNLVFYDEKFQNNPYNIFIDFIDNINVNIDEYKNRDFDKIIVCETGKYLLLIKIFNFILHLNGDITSFKKENYKLINCLSKFGKFYIWNRK